MQRGSRRNRWPGYERISSQNILLFETCMGIQADFFLRAPRLDPSLRERTARRSAPTRITLRLSKVHLPIDGVAASPANP